jgi:hypothetical protein
MYGFGPNETAFFLKFGLTEQDIQVMSAHPNVVIPLILGQEAFFRVMKDEQHPKVHKINEDVFDYLQRWHDGGLVRENIEEWCAERGYVG